MRGFFLVTLVVLTLNSCGGQSPPDTADKQIILNLDKELTEALFAGKCDAFERILADDYSGTGAEGTLQNKTQTIESCKSFASLPESIRPKLNVATSDSDIRVYQNVAVETGKRTSEQLLATFSNRANNRPPT